MASETAEVAYVAAGYLRVEMSQGVYVYLLMSKSQVKLLPKQTIPRIELLVSLILSKLITRVHSALLPLVKINEIFCWTDSIDSSMDKGGGGAKNTSNLLRTESRKSVRMCRLKCGTIVPEVRIPQTCPPVVWDQMRLNSHKYGGTVHFGQ